MGQIGADCMIKTIHIEGASQKDRIQRDSVCTGINKTTNCMLKVRLETAYTIQMLQVLRKEERH